MWSIISGSVEKEVVDFAQMLFGKKIIGRRARDAKDLNAMLDGFINCMALVTTVQEYKDNCSILLDILTDIGGFAERTGDALRASWKTAVKDKVGIADFFD